MLEKKNTKHGGWSRGLGNEERSVWYKVKRIPGKLLLQLHSQIAEDAEQATPPLCASVSHLENGLGREGRIMLEDLQAPYSSHIARFYEHEQEGGKGGP